MRHRFEDIAVNSNEKRKPTDEDMGSYIGLEHLETGDLRVTHFGSKVPIKGEKLIMRKGDVLFGRRNTYLKRAAVSPHDGLFSAHGMVLRPKEKIISNEFFPFFISSDYFFDAAIRISVGSISPTVNWGTLKELEFDLPPLDEQRRLAEVLWAMIEIRNAYRELLSLTEQLVKSQFIEMFIGITDSVLLGEISEIRSGGTPTRQMPEYYEGNIPWITTVALGNNYIDDSQAMEFITEQAIVNSATKIIPENSLLFGVRVGVGKCSVNTIPMCTNQDIVGITGLIHNGFEPLYIKKVLETYSTYFDDQKRGATIKGITTDLLKKTKIPNAPLPLQTRFADFVRQADKSKFELQRTLEELEATYKALLREKLG